MDAVEREIHRNEVDSLRRTVGSCYERGERLAKALRGMLDNTQGHMSLGQCDCEFCKAARKALGL